MNTIKRISKRNKTKYNLKSKKSKLTRKNIKICKKGKKSKHESKKFGGSGEPNWAELRRRSLKAVETLGKSGVVLTITSVELLAKLTYSASDTSKIIGRSLSDTMKSSASIAENTLKDSLIMSKGIISSFIQTVRTATKSITLLNLFIGNIIDNSAKLLQEDVNDLTVVVQKYNDVNLIGTSKNELFPNYIIRKSMRLEEIIKITFVGKIKACMDLKKQILLSLISKKMCKKGRIYGNYCSSHPTIVNVTKIIEKQKLSYEEFKNKYIVASKKVIDDIRSNVPQIDETGELMSLNLDEDKLKNLLLIVNNFQFNFSADKLIEELDKNEGELKRILEELDKEPSQQLKPDEKELVNNVIKENVKENQKILEENQGKNIKEIGEKLVGLEKITEIAINEEVGTLASPASNSTTSPASNSTTSLASPASNSKLPASNSKLPAKSPSLSNRLIATGAGLASSAIFSATY